MKKLKENVKLYRRDGNILWNKLNDFIDFTFFADSGKAGCIISLGVEPILIFPVEYNSEAALNIFLSYPDVEFLQNKSLPSFENSRNRLLCSIIKRNEKGYVYIDAIFPISPTSLVHYFSASASKTKQVKGPQIEYIYHPAKFSKTQRKRLDKVLGYVDFKEMLTDRERKSKIKKR